MSSQSEGRFVWIAFSTISGLSAVSAITTIVDDDLVFTSAAIFWMTTALGTAIAALLSYSTLKREAMLGREPK
jgi:protein involved in temperature-dependent protein secretion